MIAVGILPTISSNVEQLNKCIANIFDQSIPPQILVIVYQGSDENCNFLKNELGDNKQIVLLTTNVMSLTHAKNLALDYLILNPFDYVFVYEDDVIYPYVYNDCLIRTLSLSKAQIISAVQDCEKTFLRKARALIYSISHVYPINDIRPLVESFNINSERVFQTRFLYGGLSMYTRHVAENFRYDENLTKYALGEDMEFSFRVSENNISVITSKIKCIHDSQGTRKFGYGSLYRNKIAWWNYFLSKHYPKSFIGNIAFANLLLFLMFESFAAMILRLSISIPFAFFKSCFDVLVLQKKSDFIVRGN